MKPQVRRRSHSPRSYKKKRPRDPKHENANRYHLLLAHLQQAHGPTKTRQNRHRIRWKITVVGVGNTSPYIQREISKDDGLFSGWDYFFGSRRDPHTGERVG
ncbi:hypothetical protein TKK_0016598 [Trichogramma kaykai]